MFRLIFRTAPFLCLLLCPLARGADYVIQISVDGLGSSYLQQAMSLGEAPNFQRLLTEGAGTLNARTDYDYTVTLPNHTSMITGRPVLDKYGNTTSGHLWEENGGTDGTVTLDSNRSFHLSTTFEVAHDNGLSTALYTTKPKFELWDRSLDADHGAPDVTGADNGTDKIDHTLITDYDSEAMMADFAANMTTSPTNYTFVHFHDPDSAGHAYGWGTEPYAEAIHNVDGYLGAIFNLIENSLELNGHTAIVLTADHGGDIDFDHSDPTKPVDYTIPFLVWGAGVSAGQDLYALNLDSRLDPGTGRPDYALDASMPIRNGDSGNLALDLLGLGPIPGSSINSQRNLAVTPVPEPAAWGVALAALAALRAVSRRRRG